MKDILKIMRFDFLTVKPLVFVVSVFAVVFFFLLSLFFSPMVSAYLTFIALIYVIPLQGIADKCDLNKLYGTLPVKRSNITRARFLYIFLVHFVAELVELLFAVIVKSIKLYRILPNQNSEMMQMVREGFEDTQLMLLSIIGMFTFFCLIFLYMEMMGQINGRENEFKIIVITLGVLTVLSVAFMFFPEFLSVYGIIIPTLRLPSLPNTVPGFLTLGMALNILIFGISLIFGEITVNKLSKREM